MGDGKPDLAVTNRDSNNVSILLNNGTGGFTSAAGSPFNSGTLPRALAVGDFNRDGKLDLAIAIEASGTVAIRLGNGDGTFSAATTYAVGNEPYAVIVSDFNRDNKLDLAVASLIADTVSILLGDGNGGFTAAPGSPLPLAHNPRSLAAGDFNGDGKPDLAVVRPVSNKLSILFGLGDGTFQTEVDYETGNQPVSLATGDFNRDGKPDVIIVDTTDNGVSMLLNIAPPTLSIVNTTISEGQSGTTTATITVNLSDASGKIITVDYATAPATASAGIDYTHTSGTLVILPGQTSVTLDVPILSETSVEGDEAFVVNLSNATVNLDNTQASVTIINDDDGGLGTTVNVDCASTLLQTAINNASPGTAIVVTGTCTENILVRNEKQRIAIHGGGSATISALSNASPAVTIRGKGITLQGFTITGGFDGVAVQRGSNAVINANTIQNSDGSGIAVHQLSFAVITNNLITGHTNGAGILVSENSTARIGFNSDSDTIANPNQIHTNQVGISLASASSARIVGNYIHNNSQQGILVLRDSHADISANDVNENGNQGIELGENSVVQLGESSGSSIFELPNDTTQPNTNYGLKCTTGGAVSGRFGTLLGTLGSPKSTGVGCVDDSLW